MLQVRYAVKEYACTAVDVLARRTRLAFLNVQAAYDAAPRIVEIMAEELNWSKERQQVIIQIFNEIYTARDFILDSLARRCSSWVFSHNVSSHRVTNPKAFEGSKGKSC